MRMDETRHRPVLWQEALDGLRLSLGDTVIDATLGGGGHTLLFRSAIGETGKVVSFDMDQVAVDRFLMRAKQDAGMSADLEVGRLSVVHANFSDIGFVMEEIGLTSADAIFADLGYSSDQIEDGARGLSFLKDGPLDMRLDQRSDETAAHIVNVWSEASLAELFPRWEMRNMRKASRGLSYGRERSAPSRRHSNWRKRSSGRYRCVSV